MHRRDFLQQTAAAASFLTLTGSAASYAEAGGQTPAPAKPATPGAAKTPAVKHTFKLKYAPHFGMFTASAGEDLLDQLEFMADTGFVALEDNGMMRRAPEVQEQIGDTMRKLGMSMGVFVIDVGGNSNSMFTTGKPENRDLFAKACTAAVDVAKRVNAKWMTVVPGNFERRLPIGIQTGHVIDVLRAGADILAKNNLVMVLEPLSDTPDLFLRTSDQTYEICRAVNSPACKILFDIYHMQKNEGTSSPTSTGRGRRSATSRSVTIRAARSRPPARSTTRTSSSTCTPKPPSRSATSSGAWSTATCFQASRASRN